jgi:adenine-specific DNA-methyltransferase
MPENKRVEIKPAKGRPMLSWVGKKPLRDVIAYPAQLVEIFAPEHAPKIDKNLWKDWTEKFPKGGLLFHGDNKDVLAHLLANGFRGKVKLIYIDPPFDSGADYARKVVLRGKSLTKIESDEYSLGEQIQYTDIWASDNYLQFIYDRLLLLKELLTEDGTIWLHCDYRKDAQLRLLLDEVFSPDGFRGEIIWKQTRAKSTSSKNFGVEHNVLLYYTKGDTFEWDLQFKDYDEDKLDRYYCFFEQPDGSYIKYSKSEMRSFRLGENYPSGRRFALIPLLNLNKDRPNLTYEFKGFRETWAAKKETLEDWDKKGLIVQTEKSAMPLRKQYFDEMEGVKVGTVWDDVFPVNSQAKQKTDYPTQKPEELLERIVSTSSKPEDIILDCFIGSGTTAAVAQKLGRRWIGADINKGAIQTTAKRLQGIIEEQLKSTKSKSKPLPGMEEDETPPPAQFSFAVHRVNDYDLQIQHNEALNLAVEHLGITRTKTDSYFDGTLGKKLVKIVPFNHPITPLDMEEVKRELGNRPQEERDVVVVGYGKELAVQAWLEDWNRNRKRTGLPNQIEAKDLRVDAKSGGFFVHKPAEANIKFKRAGDKVNIEIETFLSPTIIERLKSQAGLLSPQIDDWRAMVDSVMIDSAYDGKVFNITLADVPEKKNDLVEGKYVVEAKKNATIAVKVTDMLGEEVLVVKEV